MFLFFKIIRLPNLLIIALTQYLVRWCLIYPLLKSKNETFQLQMTEVQFFLLVLSTVFIAAAGYIINDYFDIRIDQVNKPDENVVDKGIKRRVAMAAHTIINVLGIFIAFLLAYKVWLWKLALIHFICAAGLWFYSTTFKRQFLIGNVIISLFTALVPLLVGVYEIRLDLIRYLPIYPDVSFRDIWLWLFGLSGFAFLLTLMREIVKDIEDMEGDNLYGCKTMPIVLGVTKAKAIVSVIGVITAISLAYVQLLQMRSGDFISFVYFLLFVQIPLMFCIYKLIVAKDKKEFSACGNILKFIMLTGVCYLLLFMYLLLFAVK